MKRPDHTEQALPQTIGVLGGGRMGSGIAHAFLIVGVRVVVVEVNDDAVSAARGRIEKDVSASVERGKIEGTAGEWLDRLNVTTDASSFSECGLVVEAVPEMWDLKVESLRRAESQLHDDAWLATNTSSMSVDGLAGQAWRVLAPHATGALPTQM